MIGPDALISVIVNETAGGLVTIADEVTQTTSENVIKIKRISRMEIF